MIWTSGLRDVHCLWPCAFQAPCCTSDTRGFIRVLLKSTGWPGIVVLRVSHGGLAYRLATMVVAAVSVGGAGHVGPLGFQEATQSVSECMNGVRPMLCFGIIHFPSFDCCEIFL